MCAKAIPIKEKHILKPLFGNKSEKRKLDSCWRVTLRGLEPLTNSALVQFSKVSNFMLQKDPTEKPNSHKRTQSPKTSSRKKLVGSCWRTQIIRVKGKISPVCCVFAAPKLCAPTSENY